MNCTMLSQNEKNFTLCVVYVYAVKYLANTCRVSMHVEGTSKLYVLRSNQKYFCNCAECAWLLVVAWCRYRCAQECDIYIVATLMCEDCRTCKEA
jgi:hypothetical protein